MSFAGWAFQGGTEYVVDQMPALRVHGEYFFTFYGTVGAVNFDAPGTPPFPYNQRNFCHYEPIEKQIEEARVLIVDNLLRDEDERRKLPELTPAFLEKIGGFANEDELLAEVRSELEKQLKFHQQRRAIRI